MVWRVEGVWWALLSFLERWRWLPELFPKNPWSARHLWEHLDPFSGCWNIQTIEVDNFQRLLLWLEGKFCFHFSVSRQVHLEECGSILRLCLFKDTSKSSWKIEVKDRLYIRGKLQKIHRKAILWRGGDLYQDFKKLPLTSFLINFLKFPHAIATQQACFLYCMREFYLTLLACCFKKYVQDYLWILLFFSLWD